LVQIVEHIDLNEVYKELSSPEAGGTCIFVGTVRDNSKGQEVIELQFEAYDQMALSEMEKIRQAAVERWGLKKALLIHAVGAKKIGEPVVVVGASSSHRKEAFPACQYLIDELKKTVPIWKKEFFTDSSHWVSQTP
jgi:molybdopterin synthase catalytic subunit